jgi:hypothetical protein
LLDHGHCGRHGRADLLRIVHVDLRREDAVAGERGVLHPIELSEGEAIVTVSTAIGLEPDRQSMNRCQYVVRVTKCSCRAATVGRGVLRRNSKAIMAAVGVPLRRRGPVMGIAEA